MTGMLSFAFGWFEVSLFAWPANAMELRPVYRLGPLTISMRVPR